MKIVLAGVAFLISAIGFLACVVVALDGYGIAMGTLPVLRANGGVTPAGGLLLLVGFPTGLLCLWAGMSLMTRGD